MVVISGDFVVVLLDIDVVMLCVLVVEVVMGSWFVVLSVVVGDVFYVVVMCGLVLIVDCGVFFWVLVECCGGCGGG